MATTSSGEAGRMEVADRTHGTSPWDSSANIRVRLLRAQSQVERLEKDATIKGKSKNTGAEFSYKGITAEQIVSKAKDVLISHGILYTTECLEQRTVSGNKTAVYMRGYFENVDDPSDVLIRHAWGEGTDDADKGTAKATTNANKILLARTLNMSTTEYEGVDIVNHEPEARPTAVRQAEAVSAAAVKEWAATYRTELDACSTIQQLKRVREENAAMMTHRSVPQATKDYFIDKIAALEGVLSDGAPPRQASTKRGGPMERIEPTNNAGAA